MEKLNLNFRSKFDYVSSFKVTFGLDDDEANTFLWMLEMWEAKKELPLSNELTYMLNGKTSREE